MTLTSEHVATLARPFRLAEHEWRENRFVYVAESAVTARMEEVDPSWTMTITNRTVRDQQVITDVDLTICGVTRPGVGMTNIATKGDGRETNEAEKASVTDALRRAARLFGIGRYLLNVPDNVTPGNFGGWLAEQQRAAGIVPTASKDDKKPPTPPTALPGGGVPSDDVFNAIPNTNGQHVKPTNGKPDWGAWIGNMAKEGYSPSEVLNVLKVKNMNDYDGTPEQARATMLQWTSTKGSK